MRFLRVLIGALILLILIVFAVANKNAVTVSVDPLPFEIELPLYLLVFAVFFGGLVLGVVIGRLNAWSASRHRAQAEKQRQARQAVQVSGGTQPPLPPAPIA
ncbi:MAG: LapA family protein [Ferrovibrio sp.]|uniref:LapA family protein n=1 Tax=Ferrovibrio sp. TaxID=1917215 RepID=UPI00262CB388|nr:LapA family protein [Ferrovibrio sp.]MCW0233710.1 LapA family protein [Ferrovibrio sp.]